MAVFKPVVLSQDNKTHIPLGSADTIADTAIDKSKLISADQNNLISQGGDKGLCVQLSGGFAVTLDGSEIAVDPEKLPDARSEGNALKATADGLSVRADDLSSPDPDNSLTVTSGHKLSVHVPAASELISASDGNQLSVGADQKLYVGGIVIDPTDFISATDGNQITAGADGKLLVQISVPGAADYVSHDPGNALIVGSDGKLAARAVSADSDNLLINGTDYSAKLTAQRLVSAVPAKNLLTVNPADNLLQIDPADLLTEFKSQLDSAGFAKTSDLSALDQRLNTVAQAAASAAQASDLTALEQRLNAATAAASATAAEAKAAAETAKTAAAAAKQQVDEFTDGTSGGTLGEMRNKLKTLETEVETLKQALAEVFTVQLAKPDAARAKENSATGYSTADLFQG